MLDIMRKLNIVSFHIYVGICMLKHIVNMRALAEIYHGCRKGKK